MLLILGSRSHNRTKTFDLSLALIMDRRVASTHGILGASSNYPNTAVASAREVAILSRGSVNPSIARGLRGLQDRRGLRVSPAETGLLVSRVFRAKTGLAVRAGCPDHPANPDLLVKGASRDHRGLQDPRDQSDRPDQEVRLIRFHVFLLLHEHLNKYTHTCIPSTNLTKTHFFQFPPFLRFHRFHVFH